VGAVNVSDQRQLLIDIEQLNEFTLNLSQDHGRDPVDAMMMMMVGACLIYREYARDPDNLGGVHEALDKAFQAASSWWVPDDDENGSRLQ
jgi:hypothetical protein